MLYDTIIMLYDTIEALSPADFKHLTGVHPPFALMQETLRKKQPRLRCPKDTQPQAPSEELQFVVLRKVSY